MAHTGPSKFHVHQSGHDHQAAMNKQAQTQRHQRAAARRYQLEQERKAADTRRLAKPRP